MEYIHFLHKIIHSAIYFISQMHKEILSTILQSECGNVEQGKHRNVIDQKDSRLKCDFTKSHKSNQLSIYGLQRVLGQCASKCIHIRRISFH